MLVVRSRLMAMTLVALAFAGLPSSAAKAQMCDAAATCMDGSVPPGEMLADAGLSSDPDAGDDDGPTTLPPENPTTPACSCDITEQRDHTIHVCTGSFSAKTCKTLGCEGSSLETHRCDSSNVRLCCELGSPDAYSHLYEDCDHPNCESGFVSECNDLGGTIHEGPCDAPELPDDPSTEVGGSTCSVHWNPASGLRWTWMLILASAATIRRRRSRHARTPGH